MSGVKEPRLRVDDFDYELPPDAIAQTPAEPRDSSRLLVLDRATGRDRARPIRDIGRWLARGPARSSNDSRVLPARLVGSEPRRSRGGPGRCVRCATTRVRWRAPSCGVSPTAALVPDPPERDRVGGGSGSKTRPVSCASSAMRAPSSRRPGEMPLPPYVPRPVRRRPSHQTVTPSARFGGYPHGRTALHRWAAPSLDVPRRRARGGHLHVGLRHVPARGRVHRRAPHLHLRWYQRAGGDAWRSRREAGRRGRNDRGTVLKRRAHRGRRGWTDLYVTPPYRFPARSRP